MNRLTIAEKIQLVIKSSKDYRMVLFIGLLFVLLGSSLIYIGFLYSELFLIIFGGVFISFSLFFMMYTIPSSVSYYYNKALVSKYGKTTDAVLKSKEIIDNSYFDSNKHAVELNDKETLISQLNYLLVFSYNYQNKVFENKEFVEKEIFKNLNPGDLIPIKFLSIKPNQSTIRKVKFKKTLY